MSKQIDQSLPIWRQVITQTLATHNIPIANPGTEYLARIINTHMYIQNSDRDNKISTAWLQLQYNKKNIKLAQLVGDHCLISVALMPQSHLDLTQKNKQHSIIGKQAYRLLAQQAHTGEKKVIFIQLSDHFLEITHALAGLRSHKINHPKL